MDESRGACCTGCKREAKVRPKATLGLVAHAVGIQTRRSQLLAFLSKHSLWLQSEMGVGVEVTLGSYRLFKAEAAVQHKRFGLFFFFPFFFFSLPTLSRMT